MGKERTVIIDSTGLILGRMASTIAKQLLRGETVIVVNAEKAIISGRRLSILKERKEFLEVGHFRKGPYHPRRPDQIVRRTIRGMLPRKKPKGQQAYRRLKVFLQLPEEFKEKETRTIEEASVGNLDARTPYITVGELASEIGWTPQGE